MLRENFGTGILKQFFTAMAVIGSAIATSKENEKWQSGLASHDVQNDITPTPLDVGIVDLGINVNDNRYNSDIKEEEVEAGEVREEVAFLSDQSSGNDILPLHGGFDSKSGNPTEFELMKQIVGGVFTPISVNVIDYVAPKYRTQSGGVQPSAHVKINAIPGMSINFNYIESSPEEFSTIDLDINSNKNSKVHLNFPVDGKLEETENGLEFSLNNNTIIDPIIVGMKGVSGKNQDEMRQKSYEEAAKSMRHVDSKFLVVNLPDNFDTKSVVDDHNNKRSDHREEIIRQKTAKFGGHNQIRASFKAKGDATSDDFVRAISEAGGKYSSYAQKGGASDNYVVTAICTLGASLSLYFRGKISPAHNNIRQSGADRVLNREMQNQR